MMKRSFKNLLGILGFTLAIAIVFSTQAFISYGNITDGDTITVKLIKYVDGEKVQYDTTITLPNKFEFNGILTDLQLNSEDCNIDSLLQTMDIFIECDDTNNLVTEMIVKVIGEDEDINVDSLIKNINIEIIEEDGVKKEIVTIFESDDKNVTKPEIRTIIRGNDENATKSVIYSIDDDNEMEIQVIVNNINKLDYDSIIMDNDSCNEKVIVKYIDIEGEELNMKINGSKCIVIKLDVKIEELNSDDLEILKEKGVPIPSEETKLQLDELKFYPNPNNGKFNLSFKSKSKLPVSLKIYDISGKEVYSNIISDFDGIFNENINISDKGKGNYFINISQNNKILNKKIVIQ